MARKFLGGKPTVGLTDVPVVVESRTITATDPVQIAGTTSADLSADRTISVKAANTSGQAGVVSLTDSTSTTSSTVAATATAVKAAKDAADAKVPTTRTISTTAPLTGGGDLSANRTLDINNFTGDSGSGGAKGTVPAPAAGDAAAGKFLKADGTWTAPATGGAPTGATYVTLTTDATLTAERTLAGAANQIAITDGGAGSTVTVGFATTPTITSPTITGASLAGVQSTATLGNNFSLNAAVTLLRYTANTNTSLTGVSAAGGTPSDGRLVVLMNAGTGTVTLSNASASSTAAYRFSLPGATDVSIAAGEGIALFYDATSSVWRAAYPFSIAGNAATATKLATPRAINTVNFDGSADITVTAAAGTLTGATLASGVTASSLTSFGTSPSITTPNITQATATPSFSSNSYTLASGDEGKMLLASNSTTAGSVKIPTNATTAFAVGTQIHIIQTGTGQLTISAVTSGTTSVLSAGGTAASPKLRAQYSAATMLKTATDTWYVFGDIA